MSVNENTNVQTPAAPPVPPAGTDVERIKAELKAEFDKQREGLLRDLQDERRKRQEAEQRLTPPASSAAPKEDVTGDELYNVVAPVLDKHPVIKRVRELEAERIVEKAKSFLTTKTGKKWEEIEADKALQERLTSISSRYKLVGPSDDVVERAYAIMELEDLKAKEAERERAAKASAQGSMPSGSPPAPVVSSQEYDISSFRNMPNAVYSAMSEKGGFKQVGDKIVYTPNR